MLWFMPAMESNAIYPGAERENLVWYTGEFPFDLRGNYPGNLE